MAYHFDVVIVGAGISGIAAGHYVQRLCPDLSFVILEGRSRIGGTWDHFRYPGVRSDSDLHTLGYSFRPWTRRESIAQGAHILEYLDETLRAAQLEGAVRLSHNVRSASWNSTTAKWNLRVDTGEVDVEFSCGFLHVCTGCFDYDRGYSPDLPGAAAYRGQIVHPQDWPQALDATGLRTVVIGSGATAVTLIPKLAERARHVTMVQRSPTYIVPWPTVDRLAAFLHAAAPAKLRHYLMRLKYVAMQQLVFLRARSAPKKARALIIRMMKRALPAGYDADLHFTPRYDPWDQRVCLAPDGDFFTAIRAGQVSVVTDEAVGFTEQGVLLASGRELPADLVVTATGLNLVFLGKIRLDVDGQPIRCGDRRAYRGMMLDGVPNFAFSIGYTNASWTLRVELNCRLACRILKHMKRKDAGVVVPKPSRPTGDRPYMDLTSSFVLRAVGCFPRLGTRAPWSIRGIYLLDWLSFRFGTLTELDFQRRPRFPEAEVREASGGEPFPS